MYGNISEREKGQYMISNFTSSENIICEQKTAEMIQVCKLIYVINAFLYMHS